MTKHLEVFDRFEKSIEGMEIRARAMHHILTKPYKVGEISDGEKIALRILEARQ